MVDLYELSAHVTDWVDGRVSLSEFEDWFLPATWDIKGSEALVSLVDEIELNLSEFSGGYRTRDELRQAMITSLSKVSPPKILSCEANAVA